MNFDTRTSPVANLENNNMFILGSATDGPSLEPILCKNYSYAKKIFNKGNLLTKFMEAYQVVPTNNYYLVRINGKYATCTIEGVVDNRSIPILNFKALYAGSIYNDMYVLISDDYIEFHNPDEIGGDTFRFSYKEYSTIGILCKKINELFREGRIFASVSSEYNLIKTENIYLNYSAINELEKEFYFKNGEDELNFTKNQLHNRLDLAYNILQGQPISVILIADTYIDDVSSLYYYGNNEGYNDIFYEENRDYLSIPHPSVEKRLSTFHGQLIAFCKRQSHMSIFTHGVIGFNPVDNIEDIIDKDCYYIKALSSTCFKDRFDFIKESNGDIIDNGKYISSTIGEFSYKNYESGADFYDNACAGYAALLANSHSSKSLTNSIIPNISNLRYHLNDTELKKLSHLGIVTFRKSIMKNAIVVNSSVTCALDTSPYHEFSNVRMVQLVLIKYKKILDEYIGKDVFTLKSSGVLEKRINALNLDLVNSNIVTDIKSDLNLSVTGLAVIKLNIKPIYSVEYVTVTGKTQL